MNNWYADPVAMFNYAVVGNLDCWVAASGGTEEVFTSRSGRRLLYCFNPKLQQHAYIDVGQDIVLTNEEAQNALAI
jgi:hypothetical protein